MHFRQHRPGFGPLDLAALATGALVLLGSAAAPARAASSIVDAMVVPGFAPAAAAQPMPAYVAASRSAPAARGAYGGGFLEMLVGSGGPAPLPDRVIYNRPPSAAPYAPAQGGMVAYAQPQPSLEPRRMIDPAFVKTAVDYPSNHAPARSSSIRRQNISISSKAVAARHATASVSGVRASCGRA